jgi:hypothetical protein
MSSLNQDNLNAEINDEKIFISVKKAIHDLTQGLNKKEGSHDVDVLQWRDRVYETLSLDAALAKSNDCRSVAAALAMNMVSDTLLMASFPALKNSMNAYQDMSDSKLRLMRCMVIEAALMEQLHDLRQIKTIALKAKLLLDGIIDWCLYGELRANAGLKSATELSKIGKLISTTAGSKRSDGILIRVGLVFPILPIVKVWEELQEQQQKEQTNQSEQSQAKAIA